MPAGWERSQPMRVGGTRNSHLLELHSFGETELVSRRPVASQSFLWRRCVPGPQVGPPRKPVSHGALVILNTELEEMMYSSPAASTPNDLTAEAVSPQSFCALRTPLS